MRRLLILFILALISAGCVTWPVTLRHPQTGQAVRCGPYFSAAAWATAQAWREVKCIEDYQRQGYERVPEGDAKTSAQSVTPPVTGSAAAGLSGTFSGDIVAKAGQQTFSMRITFTIVQTGDQLAGAWNTTAATSGTVSGTVGGTAITGFRARQHNPCEGEFVGAAVIEGNGTRLRGSYTGTDCVGSVTASFVVDRQ